MVKDSQQARNKKKIIISRCFQLFDKYQQIILVKFTNVGSNQVQQIRKLLSKKGGQLVIAKNTLLKKIIALKSQKLSQDHQDYQLLKNHSTPKPELKALIPHLKQKVGLIFTDEPVYQLKGKIEQSKVATEAKVGAISPINYVIAPGPTGLDPSQINFFHALQISTKIQKAQIQITKQFKVCTEGKKVGNSQAALLKKLNLKPFFYGMIVLGAYDSGSILSKQIVGINPADLLEKIGNGVRNLVGLSVEIGHPTEASIPIIVANSFRNIAALSLETNYKIKQLQNITSAPVVAKVQAKKEVKQEPVKKVQAAKKVEQPKKEQEQDVGMGGLFDF